MVKEEKEILHLKHFRIDNDLDNRIDKIAKKSYCSHGQVIRDALAIGIKELEKYDNILDFHIINSEKRREEDKSKKSYSK